MKNSDGSAQSSSSMDSAVAVTFTGRLVTLTAESITVSEVEVAAFLSDAWFDRDATRTGYEISFNKYFYRHKPLRSLDAVTQDILALEAQAAAAAAAEADAASDTGVSTVHVWAYPVHGGNPIFLGVAAFLLASVTARARRGAILGAMALATMLVAYASTTQLRGFAVGPVMVTVAVAGAVAL